MPIKNLNGRDVIGKQRLFVYGTLRRDAANPFARRLRLNARFLGVARMQGRLYRVASYPGAVADKNTGEWVVGDLYLLRDPESLLAGLDAYEGADFRRTPCTVVLDGDRRLRAWAYLFRRPVSEDRRIASGEFRP